MDDASVRGVGAILDDRRVWGRGVLIETTGLASHGKEEMTSNIHSSFFYKCIDANAATGVALWRVRCHDQVVFWPRRFAAAPDI